MKAADIVLVCGALIYDETIQDICISVKKQLGDRDGIKDWRCH